MRQDVRDEVEVQVGDVDEGADAAGDEDAGEEDADGAEGEVVEDWVDEREDFEEGVVDSVDEGRVDVYEADGRVFNGDFYRLDEGGYDHFRRLDVLLVDFRLRAQTAVAGQGAQALSAAEEDVGGGGLGDEEEHEDEDGAGDPEDFPKRPTPAFRRNRKAGQEGPESGTAVGGGDPEGEGVGEFEKGVHVLHCGTAVGEAGAAEETLKETEHEEACEVVDQSRWDGEDHEDQHCDGIDWTSTDDGDFAEGRKN